MTSTTNRDSRVRSRGVLWLSGGALAVLLATMAVLAGSINRPVGDDEAAEPAADADDALRPAGVITYSVTGKGFFTARADGEFLGPVASEDALHIHNATLGDSVLSPDGTKAARIERRDDGVFLAIGRPGAEVSVTQLAGPSDPSLVAGGKGHAREVDGVPLVVAWSPDSEVLAFGSITGAPWTLNLYDADLGYVRHFEVTGGYIGELAWSATGRYLAISTYSLNRVFHTVLMLDLRLAQVRELVDGCHLTWSPDGEFLAVHRDPGPEGGAWVISSDASTRYPITREQEAFPYAWTS